MIETAETKLGRPQVDRERYASGRVRPASRAEPLPKAQIDPVSFADMDVARRIVGALSSEWKVYLDAKSNGRVRLTGAEMAEADAFFRTSGRPLKYDGADYKMAAAITLFDAGLVHLSQRRTGSGTEYLIKLRD